ncbi:MAG: phenylacetate-CoA oxygenase subunit PaaJ [Acetobacteraceae bacterium]|nr:phenylacetate-CoA oxygenase subunit PaaJ [Acetobacteraceae bacterium]
MVEPDLLVRARHAVAAVPDPEIPVLTIEDLGILCGVELEGDTVVVTITPTYTGCPAMNVITQEVRAALDNAGIGKARVETALSPAWTTDWISEAGRQKLAAFGIAPPQPSRPACPRCGSEDTELISAFGSTPCKALHRCRACREPFDAFKCH